MTARRTTLAGGAVALLSAGLLFSPFLKGVPRAFDLKEHLGTAVQVASGLRGGDSYPRWLAGFNDGWGEATLVFYPPGLYFAAAGASALLRGDIVTGFFVVLFLFAAAGAFGLFLFVGRAFGPWAGATASLAFSLVPYRVFELYDAGLYSAFAAGSLVPWALIPLSRLFEREAGGGFPRRSMLAFAGVFAAIVLTNLPTAVALAYLVAALLAVQVMVARRLPDALRVIGGGAWGAGIAAVYLVPAAAELGQVRVPFTQGRPQFVSNFLFLGSGSWMSPGLRGEFDRMGGAPALAFLAGLSVLAVARNRSGSADPGRERSWVVLVGCIGLAAFFLTTPLSALAWWLLPFLRNVNFPWRFLEPLGTAAAGAAAAAGAVLLARRGVSRLLSAVVLPFLIVLAAYLVAFDLSLASVNGKMSAAECRAGLPVFARREVYFLPKRARRAAELGPVPLVACAAPCRARVLSWEATRREVQIDAPSATTLYLRTYFFAGWKAVLQDGARVPLAVSAEEGTGRLAIAVPGGKSRVVVMFRTTPDRMAGGVASLLALTGWAVAARLFSRRSA